MFWFDVGKLIVGCQSDELVRLMGVISRRVRDRKITGELDEFG